MTVELTAEQETTLAELAMHLDRTPDDLAREAVAQYLEEQAEHRERIEQARASLARGEGLDHDEVFRKLNDRMGW